MTSAFILAPLHVEGQGVKHTSRPAPLAVVTSTGLITQSVSQKGGGGDEAPGWMSSLQKDTKQKRFQVEEKFKVVLHLVILV